MLFFYVVWLLQFHFALSQFRDHLDFQKEGEVFIKSEKFNVLKLSKHMVKDHFLNFMQRRDDEPSKKVFIDKNGLRHSWSGFNDDKNLRKSEGAISTALKDFRDGDVIISGNIEDIVGKETKIEEEDHNIDSKTKDGDGRPKDGVNPVLKPKRKPKEVVVDKVIMKPALRTDAAGKTMAITYFYCPFFGVMSLSAYVD